MPLKVELQIKKLIATRGRVGKQKKEEPKDKLTIFLTIFKNTGSENCS